jgi:hypothetical protein
MENMHDPIPELSSLSTALSELTKRVTAMADDANRDGRDALAIDLFEIERSLSGAQRRLVKLVGSPR